MDKDVPGVTLDTFLEQWRQFERDATNATQNSDTLDDKMYRQMRNRFKKFAIQLQDNNWYHAIGTSLGSATWAAWIPKDKTNFHHLFEKGLKRYEVVHKYNAAKKLIQENGHTEEGQASRSRKSETPIVPSDDNVNSNGTPKLTGHEIAMRQSVSTVDLPISMKNVAPAGSATTESPNSDMNVKPSQKSPSPRPPLPLGQIQESSLDALISLPLVEEQISQLQFPMQNDIAEDFSVGVLPRQQNGIPEQSKIVENSFVGANAGQKKDMPPHPSIHGDVLTQNDMPRYLNADAKGKSRARDYESAQTPDSLVPSQVGTKGKKEGESQINGGGLPQRLSINKEIPEGCLPDPELKPLEIEDTDDKDEESVRASQEGALENPESGEERPPTRRPLERKRTDVKEPQEGIIDEEDAEVQVAEEYIQPCNRCEISQRRCLKYQRPDGKKNRVNACDACHISKQKCTYSRRGQKQQPTVKRAASDSEDEEPRTKKIKIESAVAGPSRPPGRPRLTEEQKQKNRETRKKARAAAERAMKVDHIEVESEIESTDLKIEKSGGKLQGTRHGVAGVHRVIRKIESTVEKSLQPIENHLADIKEELTLIRTSMMQLEGSNQSIKTYLAQFIADTRHAFQKLQPDLEFLHVDSFPELA